MNYKPEHQYRCTIIRGKSQSDMEDLLPLYANMVHKFCPCEENVFRTSCFRMLSKALFNTESYEKLSESNLKTVKNHLTEIAGTLLGLYYPVKIDDKIYILESESCKYLVEKNDYPTFFKNLCLNFQFPNGAKKIKSVQEDINAKVHIKPFCYVIELLYFAENQENKGLLTKQEVGYYVLNNLDVLQGKVPVVTVYDRIMSDRKNKIKRDRLSGSYDWQHIKEQFNLLELSNIVETDSTYIWLNKEEIKSISYFIKKKEDFIFDAYKYSFETKEEKNSFFYDWESVYGMFDKQLVNLPGEYKPTVIANHDVSNGVAIKSSLDLGDEGENLVFHIEQERVRNYKARLVNKVLLLGKTKGLGYDISSIECDENQKHPEFARYIEVKSTRRTTEPNFDNIGWSDTLNLTAKEWVAAEQYGDYYNVYRVYFTKTKTFIIRIQNPFKKAENGEIEVFPTIYQMNFGSDVIEKRYAG